MVRIKFLESKVHEHPVYSIIVVDIKNDAISIDNNECKNLILEAIQKDDEYIFMQADQWYDIVLNRKENIEVFENPWRLSFVESCNYYTE